jgi:hypothetical protein
VEAPKKTWPWTLDGPGRDEPDPGPEPDPRDAYAPDGDGYGHGGFGGPEGFDGPEGFGGHDGPDGDDGDDGDGPDGEGEDWPDGLDAAWLDSPSPHGAAPLSPGAPTWPRLIADPEGMPVLDALSGLYPEGSWGPGTAPPPPAVLVGPEGGFTPKEKEAALAAGFTAVSLGPYTLKSETAVSAILAALSAFFTVRR